MCREFDIIRRRQPSLICCTKTPCVRNALVVDDDVVVRACGSPGCFAEIWNSGGYDDDACFPVSVADGAAFRDGGHVQADLVAIDAAPHESLAVFGHGDGVMLSTVHVNDAVALEVEVIDERGGVDNCIIVASSFSNSATPKAVDTPGPEPVFLINSKGVVGPGEDGFVGFSFCTEWLRLEGRLLVFGTSTLDDVVAELILLP